VECGGGRGKSKGSLDHHLLSHIQLRILGCGSIADGMSTLIPSSSNGEACSPRRQLSWSALDSLERQMAQRIETLEQHIETLERQLPSIGSGEQIGLLGGGYDGEAIGDAIREEENKNGGTVASLDGEGITQAPQCESMFPSNERGRRMRSRVSSQNLAKVVVNSSPLDESEMSRKENMFELPESTFTMLMTEEINSVGFAAGIIAAAISLTCLVLAFKNEMDDATSGNPLGLPWDVQIEVRVAQYLGRFHHLCRKSLSAIYLLAMKAKAHSSIRTFCCVSNSDW
jgi:hypothetical protein